MSVIELFFNGRKELVEIINTGGDVVKYLTGTSPICPLIGSEIKLVEKLGKGAYGAVFSIEFPNRGEKLYAVKKNILKIFSLNFFPNETYLATFNSARYPFGFKIKSSDFFRYNGIADPATSKPLDTEMLFYPDVLIDTCKTTRIFKRTDGKGKISVPPKSLVCKSTITEPIISLMVGEFARDESSINFIDTFYFATCKPEFQYTFMERVDTTLEKIRTQKSVYGKPPEEKEIISIYLQVVHALSVLQNRYAIVHGDLHTDNVFIEKVTPNTKWRGQLLDDIDTLEFELDGHDSIYIPSKESTYLAKLGDWGMAVKYPTEDNNIVIGNENIFEDGYDQEDGLGPLMPNFYSQVYDVAYFTAKVHAALPGNNFVKRIVMWMLGYDPDRPTDAESAAKFKNLFRPESGYRPKINDELLTDDLSHVTPTAILTNANLMGSYLKNPGGKVLKVATNSKLSKVIEQKTSPRRRFSKTKITKFTTGLSDYLDRTQRKSASPKILAGIKGSSRNIVVNWMAEVSEELRTSDSAFISSVAILDLYLSLVKISNKTLQAAACSAMYLAYDNDGVPVSDALFENLGLGACDASTQRQIRGDMIRIFEENQEDYIDLPNSFDFLELYESKKLISPGNRYKYARYALYVAAAEHEMLKYPADKIATCAIILGRSISVVKDNKPLEDIEKITGFELGELQRCLIELAKFCTDTTDEGNNGRNSTIYKMFLKLGVADVPIKDLDGILAEML